MQDLKVIGQSLSDDVAHGVFRRQRMALEKFPKSSRKSAIKLWHHDLSVAWRAARI